MSDNLQKVNRSSAAEHNRHEAAFSLRLFVKMSATLFSLCICESKFKARNVQENNKTTLKLQTFYLAHAAALDAYLHSGWQR